MGLETMLKDRCRICNKDFYRPREVLDVLGLPKDKLVCSECKKEQNKPKIIKMPIIKKSKTK